jgi:MSHA biogenesis protein MshL
VRTHAADILEESFSVTRAAAMLVVALLWGCATPPPPSGIEPAIADELSRATQRKPPSTPESLDRALLPPVQIGMPTLPGGELELEPRFDLSVNSAPAAQVFMSIISGTRYSMLLHPGVGGVLSLNLKDVTVLEALSTIRQLYGYEYRVEGTRIFVEPAGLQTRIFQVNYLPGQRRGSSDTRVTSGAVTDIGSASSAPGTTGAPTGSSRALETSRVTTNQQNDFWADLRTALLAVVGTAEGRSVIISPQAGVVMVRALPQELRAVEQYLRATRISMERQVMLEAKIIDVTLSDDYQTGINWAIFNRHVGVGQLSTNAGMATTLGAAPKPAFALAPGDPLPTVPIGQLGAAALGTGPSAVGLLANPTARTIATTTGAFAAANPAGAVFGLALQNASFASVLNFLESQGHVQVLSSPRVATINNQKAVLKVGTDEFFVTNITTTTTSTGSTSQTSPTVTVQPFFSGIVLDVTPQIDQASNIILHIHPSVSEVTESTRVVNFGGGIPSISLPLAKSTVSETDTVVRVTDGNIVAIGGLMSLDVRDARGGIPGVKDEGLGSLLRNSNRSSRKRELVILLKPTLIESDRDRERDIEETKGRFESIYAPPRDAR